MAATIPLHQPYQDTDGSPLDGGYLYFGVAGQNPITNPITVYWDAALTIPASQPIRTVNGYISNNGTPANVFAAVDYSLIVKNIGLVTVYSESTSANSFFGAVVALASSAGASIIGFIQAGVGAVLRTVQDKLRDQISVFDFMTSAQIADVLAGTASIDVSTALQAAFDTDKSLYFPQGVYLAGNLNITQNSVIPGQANSIRHLEFNGSTLKLKPSATYGIKIADSDFIRITDLKIDMNDLANVKGLWHSGGWNLKLDSFYTVSGNTDNTSYDLFIDGGSNPVIYQPGPDLWGAYLSEYHNVYITRMKINGPYITTLSFFNLNVSCPKVAGAPGYSVAINDGGSLSFYSPIIQGSGSAFYFTGTCSHIKIYSLYSEGCDYIYNGTATLSNVVSLGGQTSVLVAYKNIAINTAYHLDDHPNGLIRQQYTADTLRSNNGYTDELRVMNKTAGFVSSDIISVEPGGWSHANGLVMHSYKVESATPLVARYSINMNRGDVGVEAFALKWDTTNAVPWMMLGSNAGDPTAAIDTAGYNVRIRTSSTPASSAAAGNAGEIRWDTSYIYVCTAANTWKRVALVAF